MRGRVLFVLMTGLVLSCSDQTEIPADVLPPQRMGAVMGDIAIAEAWVENYFPNKANGPRDSAIAREVDKVLAIHKVDQPTFRRSYQFYKDHPVEFKDLLDSVFHQNQNYQQRIFSAGRGAAPPVTDSPPRAKPVPVQ